MHLWLSNHIKICSNHLCQKIYVLQQYYWFHIHISPTFYCCYLSDSTPNIGYQLQLLWYSHIISLSVWHWIKPVKPQVSCKKFKSITNASLYCFLVLQKKPGAVICAESKRTRYNFYKYFNNFRLWWGLSMLKFRFFMFINDATNTLQRYNTGIRNYRSACGWWVLKRDLLANIRSIHRFDFIAQFFYQPKKMCNKIFCKTPESHTSILIVKWSGHEMWILASDYCFERAMVHFITLSWTMCHHYYRAFIYFVSFGS